MLVTFKTLIIVLLCLVGLNFHPGTLYAQSGITISPLLRDITLGPGLIETSAELTLQNNTNQTIHASLQLVDLRALGEYGGTTLDKAGLTGKYDLAKWLSLPGGDSVIIASRQTIKVKVNVVNRADLSPGGHYGGIVITTAPDNNVPKSDVSVNQQLVSLLFVKKLGGEVYGLHLESSSYKPNINLSNEITNTFKNTGNVHVIPRGYVEVTDPSGKLIAKGTTNQDSLTILPGGARRFVTHMQPVSKPGRPGSYKVTTYYRFDGENDFKQSSQIFKYGKSYAWLYIAGGIFILAITAGGFYILKNKRHVLVKSAK